MIKNNKGIATLTIVLIIVAAVVVIGGAVGGYFIYKSYSNSNNSAYVGDSIFDIFGNEGNPKWKEMYFAESSTEAVAYAIDEENNLWEWGFDDNSGSKIPIKIASDVSYYSIGDDKWDGFSSWKGLINTKGELLYWSDVGDTSLVSETDSIDTIDFDGEQISVHKKCDNVKKTEIRNNACVFLNNNGELYMWGKYYSHFTDIINEMNQPVLISDDIKDYSLTTQGFMWILDNSGKLKILFCGRDDMGETIDVMDNVKSISARPEACCVVTNNGDVYIVPNARGKVRIITAYEYMEIARNSKSNIISAGSTSLYAFVSADKYDVYNSNYNKPSGCKSEVFSLEEPLKISENAIDASMGLNHVLILKEDNTLWSWGFNEYGQLGIGNFDYSIHDETQIMEDVEYIQAGLVWSAAITKHGKLYTWGNNKMNMLGQGHSQYMVRSPRRVDVNVNGAELDEQLGNMKWTEQDYVDYYIQKTTPYYLFNGDKYQVDITYNPDDSKTRKMGVVSDNYISLMVRSEEDERYGNRLPYMYIDTDTNTDLETGKKLDWKCLDFISRLQ